VTDLILKEILTSDLIADLTNSNPNVFYEGGLAHRLGNDLLLLTQVKESHLISKMRTIFYDADQLLI